jgi:hypothetical protein
VRRGASFKITFSERVTGISASTVRLRTKNGNLVAVQVRFDATTKTLTVDPINKLHHGRLYRLRLRDGIKDLGGLKVGAHTFSFRVRR